MPKKYELKMGVKSIWLTTTWLVVSIWKLTQDMSEKKNRTFVVKLRILLE